MGPSPVRPPPTVRPSNRVPDDRILHAIDLSSGAVRWSASSGTQLRSSPAIASDRIIVGGNNGGIFCLSRESHAILWRTDAGGGGCFSSPAIARDVVYVGSRDGTIYALSLEDGSRLWSHTTAYGIYSSPTIAEETLYIG